MSEDYRHISLRVPWHDLGWDGRVCAAPRLNGSCLKLKGISSKRNDDREESVAGKSIGELSQSDWPCCMTERATFMSPFEYVRMAVHPYTKTSAESHGHFAPTPLRHPAYSAPAVPFNWMLHENMAKFGGQFGIDVEQEREPDLGFKTSWVQHEANQRALLDCFAGHLKPERSLCFFYAKKVPFVEDAGGIRVLVGVGRVQHVAPCLEYEYDGDSAGKLRSVLYERVIQHSIRPGFKDGFLLPYHAAMAAADDDPDIDVTGLAALAPEDRIAEFSFASELVTHDGAIGALLACAESLRKAKTVVTGSWDQCLSWIDDRVGELWTARGPCPGLGSTLSAFGLDHGTFIAQEIAARAGENEDPWPLVNRVFSDPQAYLPKHLADSIGTTMRAKWAQLKEERRDLLKLLSRFEVTKEQATRLYVQEERSKANIDCSDADLIANPYLIYEMTRYLAEPVSVWTADRGVFPPEVIRAKHPLPEPSALDAGTDARRVRALSVSVLETAATNGNTLLSQEQVVLGVRELPIDPLCLVDGDLMEVARPGFGGAISEASLANGAPALQLGRLSEAGEVIRNSILKRIDGARLVVEADWRARLDDHLRRDGVTTTDDQEEPARLEKVAALKELAESRLSVLVGPAGTGKTTLLSVLCSHPQVAEGDVLLLAPTGKARVRMEQSTEHLRLKGYTIAQFLSPHRYDGTTGRYHLSERPVKAGAKTVIVDEASMLTEEMLAALLQALRGVQRLILIGDPRQLPPIGAGRPFVDIVKRLAPDNIENDFPRVAKGYSELTIQRRQIGEEREDMRLAQWFSGGALAPGEDDVFDKVAGSSASAHVRFLQWDTPDELRARLLDVIVEELKLEGVDDIAGFDRSLGGADWNDKRFFNFGAAKKAEEWQILSPVRTAAHGVPEINRLIHRQFRSEMVALSRRSDDDPKYKMPRYTKPMGPEEIVYGDKVINLVNTDPNLFWNKHRRVWPQKDNAYIANGEIGMAIGYYMKRGGRDFRWKLEVEFSSQEKHKYDFTNRDFGEEGNPVLELAYALTVHKSQGSEFGTVILILPNPCRLLSRELLYTALTRQRNRIVILHQGALGDLRKYSSDTCSETARRLTNLFGPPSPIEIDGRFFEEHLIHRTSRGEMVRSKSEVIIADHLASAGIDYGYEQPLRLGGLTRYPDFTIDDAESGRTYYWEHCGMLHVPSYLRRWEEKLDWYKSNGVLPSEEGSGPNGTLIVSRDESNGSINSEEIGDVVKRIAGA